MPNLERATSRRQMTEDFDPNSHDSLYASIPTQLREGTTMLKVSAKKVQRRLVKLKAEAGQLLWESKHAGMRASVPALRYSLFAQAS
jgi:phosphatidylinositol phospholipase C delta